MCDCNEYKSRSRASDGRREEEEDCFASMSFIIFAIGSTVLAISLGLVIGLGMAIYSKGADHATHPHGNPATNAYVQQLDANQCEAWTEVLELKRQQFSEYTKSGSSVVEAERILVDDIDAYTQRIRDKCTGVPAK